MVFQVRNMESESCIAIVKNELNTLGLNYKKVDLGEVELFEDISSEKMMMIDVALRNAGLELFYTKDNRLVEKIKQVVCQFINLNNDTLRQNLSDYVRDKVNYDYNSLSYLFSNIEGTTIENYYIKQKIELAKILLTDLNLTISEISYKLHYSSVGHLSNQFKKITGFNPTCYRQLLFNNQQPS